MAYNNIGPRPFILEDHFMSNDAVTDNAIGQLDWQFTTIANASTLAFQTGVVDHPGILRQTTAGADGDGSVLHLFPDGICLGGEGGQARAVIRLVTSLTSNDFRFGLGDSVTATRPTKGVSIEGDAGVLSCYTDSAANGDESVAVSGDEGTRAGLTSGTTAVVGEWLDLAIRWGGTNANSGPDEVNFYVGSNQKPVLVATLPCHLASTETVELSLVHAAVGSAAAVILDVDYIGYEIFDAAT